MTDHTLEGFVKGMSMEERATRVVASIEMNRVLARDWSHEKVLLKEIVAEYLLEGVTEDQVAEMYLERQKSFLGKRFGISHKPKASKSGEECKWPLGCGHKGPLHADHILPKSAFSEGSRALYAASQNSISLCPTHNSILKGNHISTGLWIRGMLK